MASRERENFPPAELMNTLAAKGIADHSIGTLREITFLCADVRGAAGLAEDLTASLFRTLAREVASRSGITQKLEDLLVGYWGAPTSDPNHALNACEAALACKGAFRAAGLTHNGLNPLRLQIGICSRRMVIGNIETDGGPDYQFVEDAAETAARFKSVNQQYGTEVVIGDETRRLAGSRVHVRELDRLAFGKSPVQSAIYELLAIAREGESPPSWVDLYEMGLANFRGNNLQSAIGYFQMLLTVRDSDRAALYMIDRCRSLLDLTPLPLRGE